MPPLTTERLTFGRRFVRRGLLILVRLLYRVEYLGLDHVPAQGPLILVANHTHLVDVLAIHCRVRPWISWVGKQELFRIPLLGRVLRWLGGIPVNRDKPDLATARGIMQALAQNGIVGMFPQGTRVPDAMIPYVRPRSGAAHFAKRLKVPLLPVAVSGRFRLLGRIRIIYGEPFHLQELPEYAEHAMSINDLAEAVMRRIYALDGKEYTLLEPADDDESGN
ncbi:MAG: lysophospholipid acyltransferase family protein [Eubacteriales bacterium]|nr:lysophospholipid acyltransferase family protein [Eubacteriales bacterium]